MCNQCQIPNSCNRANNKLINTNANGSPCMYYTLEFLINNAIGENNKKTKRQILEYLRNHECNIPEEYWSQTVLQTLKDEKIVVTIVYGGGVFIPCHTNDLDKAIDTLTDRIKREKVHLECYKDIKNGL